MKKRSLFAILLTIVLLLSMLAGCGGSSAPNDAMSESYSPPGKGEGIYESNDTVDSSSLPENRKLIKTVYIDAETEDLDTLLSQLDQQVSTLGGYMQERYIHNGSAYTTHRYRRATLTIRIPADKVDAFIGTVEGYSNVISTNQSIEDVTLNYVATESRMKALQIEEARLLELLEKAETMADLLEIESRLTDVRYELENITSQLKLYDNLIDYATIHLEVSQVQELTQPEPETFWDRISTGFAGSLGSLWDLLVELVIFLIVASPYLVVIAMASVLVLVLIKRRKKGKPNPPTDNTNQ